MSPIGHLAVGFAAKRAVPKVPLVVLLVAAWLPDVLFFVFNFTGMESREQPAPFSHGLLMNVLWSLLTGLVALGISLDRRVGTALGLVVFSHWALDFVSWNNLPLFLRGSRTVGLGLINEIGNWIVVFELALFGPAVASYIAWLRNVRRERRIARGEAGTRSRAEVTGSRSLEGEESHA
jgi:hypothetical protein